MLSEFTNLAWPQTPYAADQRPFAKNVRLLTGMSIQWADEGTAAVPVGAAAVFVPVKRTARREITADTLHFGYRSVAIRSDSGPADILDFVDSVLVQARRDAEVLGWHSFPDDLHALRPLLKKPYAGIDAVGDAWADRTFRERGTALFVDTADAGMRLDSALTAARLDFDPELWRYRAPAFLQQAYQDLTASAGGPDGRDRLAQYIGAAGIMSALAVALLAGRQVERLSWDGVFDVAKSLRLAAWDTVPLVLTPAG